MVSSQNKGIIGSRSSSTPSQNLVLVIRSINFQHSTPGCELEAYIYMCDAFSHYLILLPPPSIHSTKPTLSLSYFRKMSTLHPEEKADDLSVPDLEMASSEDDSSAANVVPRDKKELRRMTWQKAAWLLAGDQVCLAIMAQSWSLSYVHM